LVERPWRRFVGAYRNFGLGVALRVAASKVRGVLHPASAMPEAPTYDGQRRELTLLVDAAEHEPVALQRLLEALAGRGRSDWEICISERSPLRLEVAHVLSRFRGACPWIRIVSADGSVEKSKALQWTVEQSTGEYVGFLAPGWTFDADAVAGLVTLLRNDARVEAAMLLAPDVGAAALPKRPRWGDCRLLAQRKSTYLDAAPAAWSLGAPVLAKVLEDAGARMATVAARG
jgi:hypothetical protein